MLEVLFATVGGLAVGLALASRPLRSWPLTEPLAALLLGVALGPSVLGLVELPAHAEAETLGLVAELVLAASLMSVALRFPLETLRAHLVPVALLLTVGMVGMALVTAGLGVALGLPLAAAVLLGAVVAPTDPVLASSIVAGAPARRDLPLRLRAIISLESGANDGLALVIVLLALAFTQGAPVGGAVLHAVSEVLVAVVVGAALGWLCGRLVVLSERHRDIEHSAFLALTLSVTACTYGVAKLVGGSAVVAVFAAGIAYAHGLSQAERAEEQEVQEAINQYLVLPAFTLFGIALPWAAWGALGWRGPALAVAVLVLRRVPLLLALGGLLRLSGPERVFAGWFGPIGVAALFYLAEARLQGALDASLWALGTLIIAASTLAHGVTAAPGRRLLAHREPST